MRAILTPGRTRSWQAHEAAQALCHTASGRVPSGGVCPAGKVSISRLFSGAGGGGRRTVCCISWSELHTLWTLRGMVHCCYCYDCPVLHCGPWVQTTPERCANCKTWLLHPPLPLCDIPSGCCFFTGPWTVTRFSLRMLRRVAAFCRPLRPVLLLVLFPRLWSPVVGVLGLCWVWQYAPFVRQQRPVVGVLGLCWLMQGSFDCFCYPHPTGTRALVLTPNEDPNPFHS